MFYKKRPDEKPRDEKKVKEFLNSLLYLEINTLLVDRIQGKAFPKPGKAAQDLEECYRLFLNSVSRAAGHPKLVKADDLRESFKQIVGSASTQLPCCPDERQAILQRVHDKSETMIKKMAVAFIDWDPEDLVWLREAWELGTDEIVVQTQVMLHGDQVTRICRAHSRKAWLHQLHFQSVRASVDYWQDLFRTVSQLLNDFAHIFFSKT
jgi:hypothetical protein